MKQATTSPESLALCVISDERFPCWETDTQQLTKTVAALAEHGAKVELLVPRRWRSLLKSAKQRRSELESYYQVSGNFALREMLTAPASLRVAAKLVHGLLAPANAALRGHATVYTREIMPAVCALLLGRELVFDTFRPLPDLHPFYRQLFQWMASRPTFLGVTTHSAVAREAFLSAGLAADSVAVVYNGYDPNDRQPRLSQSQARARLDFPREPFLAVYTGHVRPDKGIGFLIEAMAQAPRAAQLLLVGDSPEEQEWVARETARCGAGKRVSCVGWVTVDHLALYLQAADVLVIPPSTTTATGRVRTVLPMKIFLYLAAGRPILATDQADVAEVLQHRRNALLQASATPQAMAQGLALLHQDRALGRKLGKQARSDAGQYTWSARAKKLLQFIHTRRQMRE